MKDIDYFVLKNQQENLGFNISCPITIMFVELKCTPCMSKIKFHVALGKKERGKKKDINFFFNFDICETYQQFALSNVGGASITNQEQNIESLTIRESNLL